MKKALFIIALASVFIGSAYAENIPAAQRSIRLAIIATKKKDLPNVIKNLDTALLYAPIYGNTKKFINEGLEVAQEARTQHLTGLELDAKLETIRKDSEAALELLTAKL